MGKSYEFYMNYKTWFTYTISRYRMHAIISRGLYIFYPITKYHLCTVTFGLMYGLYSRAASNQERPMMARVRYIKYYGRGDNYECSEKNSGVIKQFYDDAEKI